MNAPGKGMLKVVSILFIVFGAIAFIVSLLAVLGSAVVTAYTAGLASILLIASIVMMLASVLELVIGIIGLKKCGDPAQGGFFVTTGSILCIVALISLILRIAGGSFGWTGFVGFVLPILYIVGGVMNKKAVNAAPQAPPVA
jgi:hypothetical protein